MGFGIFLSFIMVVNQVGNQGKFQVWIGWQV